MVVVCDDERDQVKSKSASGEAGLHPGYLKASMVVMDLTAPKPTAFMRAAVARGCGAVLPQEILPQQLILQSKEVTGQKADAKVLREALAPFFEEE